MRFFSFLLLLAALILNSCNYPDINDESKRNENWIWWVDKANSNGRWLSMADQGTVNSGDYTTFYSNGKIYSVGRLKDGVKTDTTSFYNYEGKKIKYIIYSTDTTLYYPINGKYTEFFATGKIKAEGFIDNHQKTGMWTFYHENGMIKEKSNWKENMQEGNFSTWYANGKLETEISVKNGKLEGLQKDYYENGTLRGESNWINGMRDGPLTMYYANGQLGVKAIIRNGDKHSIWQCYDSTGQIMDHFPKEFFSE